MSEDRVKVTRTLTALEPQYLRQIPCAAFNERTHYATMRERWQTETMDAPAFTYWCERHKPEVTG